MNMQKMRLNNHPIFETTQCFFNSTNSLLHTHLKSQNNDISITYTTSVLIF